MVGSSHHEVGMMLTSRSETVFAMGAFLAMLGIGLGAFGAHMLRGIEPIRLGYWTTATNYWFIAAFGVMFAGLLDRSMTLLSGPPLALLLGILVFSGSLYAMALGGPRWLGAITPLGGMSYMVGFFWLGLRALLKKA
jgi:uncharacterized membrane protein YgdD (TMEM256/DUF423 family)